MSLRDTAPHLSFRVNDKPCRANLEGCKVERLPGFSYCQPCKNRLNKDRKRARRQGKVATPEKERGGKSGA
jgi:hypothetical protein